MKHIRSWMTALLNIDNDVSSTCISAASGLLRMNWSIKASGIHVGGCIILPEQLVGDPVISEVVPFDPFNRCFSDESIKVSYG
jgi:hypothetical protein